MTVYRRPRCWWQRRPKMRSERWDDLPANWEVNDGWGICNTGADAPGICALGGIGCNVDHRFIWESGPGFPYVVERKGAVMPGMSGPNEQWPLTVKIETPTASFVDPTDDSHCVHRQTGENVAHNVRIDLTVRAQSGSDCDAVMNTLLALAFPSESVALLTARIADEIDVSTYGGPPASLPGQVTTTYLIRCDRFPTPYRTGPRLVQP